eukprot:GHRR01008611.1.p1 GENE.GHRR01008611.1~~GHRR01008611.1.p1  ORF type:complete len:130 (+),score=26.97 GHRR01008611.1:33-392(+)
MGNNCDAATRAQGQQQQLQQSQGQLHQQDINAVGFTCQITAAFRAVEVEQIAHPIIRDPLAKRLAGPAYSTAYSDWQKLVADQGPGHHLRVPARNRVIDNLLSQVLQQVSNGTEPSPSG